MSKQPGSKNEKNWAMVVLDDSGKFLESLTMADKCQTRFKLIPTEHLNRATQVGVIDMTLGRVVDGRHIGAPTIRFDNPHGGRSNFHHINIDPQGFSARGNPHIRVPESLISCASKIDKCLKAVSKTLLIVALVTDGIRILGAIYRDMNDKEHTLPYHTITTIAEIAGGWAGSALGAAGGALLGAKIGACVGSLFGVVGAVIGAPIGAVVGAMVGGFAGGLLGSYLAGGASSSAVNFLEAQDWSDAFQLTFAALANPAKAVSDVVQGLTSNEPEKRIKAASAVTGAVAGATIGSALGPPGAIVGGAIGFGIGMAKRWF